MNYTSRMITGGLVALAIACRMAAVWVLQSHQVPRSTYEHGEIAANLVAGKGFTMRFLVLWGRPLNRHQSIPQCWLWRTRLRESNLPRHCCFWSWVSQFSAESLCWA